MRANPNQRSLRSSELSLVTVLDLLQIGILDCKSQFDIVNCSLGIVPPRFFSLKLICFISFPRSSHLMLFSFSLCMIYVINVNLDINN